MEMHQVRYFLAAAKHLNFTRAAEECGVSGPSLLRALRLLETEFGGPLFNRERRRTHLSELGKIALPHLEQLVREAAEAKRKAGNFLNMNDAALKLGIMCTLSPGQFVPFVSAFRSRYPSVILTIVDGNAAALQSALLAGELEAAIYCMPGEAEHERLHAVPLFREQMVIALSPAHALAKRTKKAGAIKVVDLDGQPYLERVHCEFAGYGDRVFAEKAVDGPTVYRSDRDDWVLAMVAAGMGYSFIPKSIANYPGVVSRPLQEPEFWRTINLVTVRGRRHSPVVGAVVRELVRTKWAGESLIPVVEEEPAE